MWYRAPHVVNSELQTLVKAATDVIQRRHVSFPASMRPKIRRSWREPLKMNPLCCLLPDAEWFRPVGGADFSALMMWQVVTGVLLVPLGWCFSEAATARRNIIHNFTEKHMGSISVKFSDSQIEQIKQLDWLHSKVLGRFATTSVKKKMKEKKVQETLYILTSTGGKRHRYSWQEILSLSLLCVLFVGTKGLI